MDAWDLSLLDAAEGRQILWARAVRCPPVCDTMCRIDAYHLLIAEMDTANDAG